MASLCFCREDGSNWSVPDAPGIPAPGDLVEHTSEAYIGLPTAGSSRTRWYTVLASRRQWRVMENRLACVFVDVREGK